MLRRTICSKRAKPVTNWALLTSGQSRREIAIPQQSAERGGTHADGFSCCPAGTGTGKRRRPTVSRNPLSEHVDHLAQSIAARVVNLILEAVDVGGLVERIDVNEIVERVDINALVERININEVVDRIDVNALVERIDINGVVERVDLDAVVGRADVNALVERIDINELVERVDVDSVVGHSDLGSLIAQSTTSVMVEVLDVVRAQGVGLDDLFNRWVDRMLRRTSEDCAPGPALVLVARTPGRADEHGR